MPYRPTLKQLRYLCALGEHLHFGQAARACHISQSTLSGALSELEENLGVTLVERSHRRVALTPIGTELVRRSQQIIAEVDELVSTAVSRSGPLIGELRLGVIPTIAPFLMPRLMRTVRDKYPDLQLYMREETGQRLLPALQAHELDVLLLTLPFPAEQVECHHLFHDECLLVCPPEHPVARDSVVHTRDLRYVELLLLEDGHCLPDHALEAVGLSRAELNVPYQATSLNTLVQMVADRAGSTLMPEMAIGANVLSGTDLVTRRFSGKPIQRSIGLMWRSGSSRRHELLLLGELIRTAHGGSVDSQSGLAV